MTSTGSGEGDAVRLRPVLGEVPAYTPGKAAPVAAGARTWKVSSNENPNYPLPAVLEVMRQAAQKVNRYPDMANTELTMAIAQHLDVPAARVACGPGSVGVLGQVVQAACDAGDEVVFAWRSFEAYPIITTLAGATPVMVPLTSDARHDLDAMAAAVTDRTRVVLVCTPNNPTGPSVRRDELVTFLDRVPRDVVVVIDQAYVEFVTTEDPIDGIALMEGRPNVVVLRTFSKAYGLAGLRVGYAVAHEPVAEALRKTAIPFGVNSVAQTAAVASLKAEDELMVRVKDIVSERDRVVAALRGQGWDIPESDGNFVWFDLGDATLDFAEQCEEFGLTVRPFAGEGVRASIDRAEANDALVEIARRYRALNF